MPNYWIVGATIGGQNYLEAFVRRGHWYMINEKPHEKEKREQIKPGDRIAIKRMTGPAQPEIEIRALGIVTENDLEEECVYVNWVVSGLERRVPSQGAYATIHGPFAQDDEWTRQAFQL
ncbi:MAG TPA: hypothetical protein VKD72_32680 [Gemmataceae bacterium]|nr:hypothetical protein [Gemmataceae bacterium]